LKDALVIAHVKQDDTGNWLEPHLLMNHLESVAELTKGFAQCFDSSSWGYATALGHDLGKSTLAWQQYIRSKSGYGQEDNSSSMIDHSSPSAKVVGDKFPGLPGKILSYVIAGHHAGLPDYRGSQASLLFRLQQAGAPAKMIPPAFIELLDTYVRKCSFFPSYINPNKFI
jgi:CRISPR-associated endonuclease/helicase Cas3